jgi:hypothetical protein
MDLKRMDNKTISVKVFGDKAEDKATVDKLIAEMKKVFPLIIVGKVQPNDKDNGCHVFITVNPFQVNVVSE